MSEKQKKYSAWTIFIIILLIFVCGGIFGFIYEELFYRIDLGYFVKRGTTFGPWIPIYGVGALFISLFTFKLRKRPWLVFIVGGAVCGILEFVTGYLLYHNGGIRLWDYNVEIWNWGNIGGYFCIRSVVFFAASSLILIYIIIPFIKFLERKLSKVIFSLLGLVLGFAFLLDIVLTSIFHLK